MEMMTRSSARRTKALNHLCEFGYNVPKHLLESLVCHRGFHDPNDSLYRPVENTLEAFNSIWKSSKSLKICECDVSTTKDGTVIVGHDDSFKRLSLIKDKLSEQKICDSLFQEYEKKLELIDGSKVLTLQSLLLELQQSSPGNKLIVEIKSTANVHDLVNFFVKHQPLLNKVPVIMSFSPKICKAIKKALKGSSETKVLLLMKVMPLEERLSQSFDNSSGYIQLDLQSSTVVRDMFKTFSFARRKDKDRQIQVSNKLDGVYLQFRKEMLQEGSILNKKLCEFCAEVIVGIYFLNRDKEYDTLSTVQTLNKLGVDYINTDIPK